MRTTEEILNDLQRIVNASEGRSMTDDEVTSYENLERELQSSQRTEQVRIRNRAYNTPVPGQTNGLHGDFSSTDSELERAFTNYLRTGHPNQDIANLRVNASGQQITNAQSEGTSSAGGYMVPTVFRQKIVEVQKSFGGIESVADVYTTGNGQPVEFPTINDTANSGTITAENATFSNGADLVFGTVALGAYKYTSSGASNAPLKVSVELAQDSAFDIESLVARKLGERIHRKEAANFATGTGVNEPLGLVASSLTADVELDTPDTIVYKDLMDAYDALDAAYEDGAVWVMKKNTWSQVRRIVDIAGRPLVQDQLSGIGGAPAKELLSYRVVIDEAMPTVSSAADGYGFAFGNIREAYVIRRVAPLVVIVNPYSSASSGQIEYTAWERADGNIQNRNAYVILSNNT